MKILHVAESVRGGCGTYLNELLPLQANELGADNVRVVLPRQHASHLTQVHPRAMIPFGRPTRLAGLPSLASTAVLSAWHWRPDLVHLHSSVAGAVLRALSFAPGMPPIVYCPHGWAFDMELSPRSRSLIQTVERALAPRCERIIAISRAEADSAASAGIAKDRIALITNGIPDLPQAPTNDQALPDPRLRVLFVGRLDRQKGVDVLLRAVESLETTTTLRVIGDCVASAPGRTARSDYPHVTRLGWLDQRAVFAEMSQCDVVVVPSRWEGFGLVAVEAMRAAKPVFASSVGGLAEIVVEGETGRLFPVDDHEAIRSLLQTHDRDRLRQMGLAGRSRFLRRYTISRTHQGLMELYGEVLGRSLVPAIGLVSPH